MNEEVKSIKALMNKLASTSKKVFIIGHNNPDLDSLASAIGLQALLTALGKEAYIILDEPEKTIEPAVKKVRDQNKDKYNIIDMDTYHKLRGDNQDLIVTDVNKKELIKVGEELDDFNEVIVIDHHYKGPTSIGNATYYIPRIIEDEEEKITVSSASEIVAQLLFFSKMDYPEDVYTYLYGGIYLDTNRFDKNVGPKTHEVTQKLCSKGADTFTIKELLLSDFEEDRIIYNLVFNETLLKAYVYDTFNNCTIAFTLNRDKPESIYKRETLAKAADRLLDYKIDASFVMGYISDETISVSARSKGLIDVGRVMDSLGGGGNKENAAAQVKDINLEDLEAKVHQAIDIGLNFEDDQSPQDSTVLSRPKQYQKTNK